MMINYKSSLFTLFFLLLSSVAFASDTLKLQIFHNTAEFSLTNSHEKYLDSALQPFFSFSLKSYSIIASCDDIGSDNYNKQLAKKRADAVAKYLSNKFKNTKTSRSLKALGELPLNSSDTLQERAKNRQVSIILVLEKHEITFENIQVGQKLAIENLLFLGGYPVLLKESFGALDSLVAKMLRRSELNFKIIGHVCCWPYPGDGYNNQSKKNDLSLMRAKAVYDYLIEKGIDKNRMTYIGMGGTEPLGKGDKYDRRVEIEIVK